MSIGSLERYLSHSIEMQQRSKYTGIKPGRGKIEYGSALLGRPTSKNGLYYENSDELIQLPSTREYSRRTS